MVSDKFEQTVDIGEYITTALCALVARSVSPVIETSSRRISSNADERTIKNKIKQN